MLHKCANPGCAVPFRSLHEGKLFLAETFSEDSDSGFDGTRRKMRKREHFWLCGACSAHFTLHFDVVLGMLTVPIGERPALRPIAPRAAFARG
jgi:hypothetical protein